MFVQHRFRGEPDVAALCRALRPGEARLAVARVSGRRRRLWHAQHQRHDARGPRRTGWPRQAGPPTAWIYGKNQKDYMCSKCLFVNFDEEFLNDYFFSSYSKWTNSRICIATSRWWARMRTVARMVSTLVWIWRDILEKKFQVVSNKPSNYHRELNLF